MKTHRFLTRGAALALAAILLFGIAFEGNAAVNRALVRQIDGKAWSSTDGTKWERVRKGKAYLPGTTLKTARKTTLDLFLGDNGPAIRVKSDSRLVIEKLDIQRGMEPISSTRLRLEAGQLFALVRKLTAGSTYEIVIPSARISVRGTVFSVSDNGSVAVLNGSILVERAATEKGLVVGPEQTLTPSMIEPRPISEVLGSQADALRQELGIVGFLWHDCGGTSPSYPSSSLLPSGVSPFADVNSRRRF